MPTINKNFSEYPDKKLDEEISPEGSYDTEEKEVSGQPKEAPEKRDLTQEEIEHNNIRSQIEGMDLDEHQKAQVKTHAATIQPLEVQGKLKHLLALAQSKGVVFAVKVAKDTKDPYILDMFHDLLAKEGHYKKFVK